MCMLSSPNQSLDHIASRRGSPKKKKKKELELKQLIPSGARNEQMEQEGKG